MAKYLDATGVSTLWGKIKSSFASSSHTHDYLPLNGGTMTDAAVINLSSDAYINYSPPDWGSGWSRNIYRISKGGTTLSLGGYGSAGTVLDYIYLGDSYLSNYAIRVYSSSEPQIGSYPILSSGNYTSYVKAIASFYSDTDIAQIEPTGGQLKYAILTASANTELRQKIDSYGQALCVVGSWTANSHGFQLFYGVNNIDNIGYRGRNSDGWGSIHKILHDGNYSNYAVSTSGGIVSSSAFGAFGVERTTGVHASAISYYNTNGLIGYLGLNDDGYAYRFNASMTAYKIWDSGNHGSGSGLDADLLDGYHKTRFFFVDGTFLDGSATISLNPGLYVNGSGTGASSDLPNTYGSLVSFGDAYYSTQMWVRYNASVAYIRSVNDYGTNASSWHQLAFVDSNVASATYAASAGNAETTDNYHLNHVIPYYSDYTLTQSSGGVTGGYWYLCIKSQDWSQDDLVIFIYGVGNNQGSQCVIHAGSRDGHLWGWQTDYNVRLIEGIDKRVDSATEVYLKIPSSVTILEIKGSQALSISEDSTYSSRSYYAVNSGLFATNPTFRDVTIQERVYVGNEVIINKGSSGITMNGDSIYTHDSNNTYTGQLMYFDRTNFRVGIGTNTPGCKLDVRGEGYFSGGISISSRISVDSGASVGIVYYPDSTWGSWSRSVSRIYTSNGTFDVGAYGDSGSTITYGFVGASYDNGYAIRVYPNANPTVGSSVIWNAGNSNTQYVDWAANNLSASGTLTVSGISTLGGSYLILGRGGNTINSRSDAALFLNYYDSNDVCMCMGGGNVGIGTSSPQYKLDVNGSANSTTLYENGNRVITSGNIGSQSVNYATSAGSASSVPSMSNSEIDTIMV